MKCPYCGDENTRVIDSRPADDNSAIRRRRQCDVCGKRFTTYEKVETVPLMVIKKDKTREPYDKAGAYAIQGWASVFISGIKGSYYTVVGFPLHKVYGKLRELGYYVG